MNKNLITEPPKKCILASFSAWSKLRRAAFMRESNIKTVLDDLIEGRINYSELGK